MTVPQDLPDEAHRLADAATRVLQLVQDEDCRIATAESCTGGLIASLFTDIEGLSNRFDRGFVTYTEEAKCELLGIEPAFIVRHGVVSREVAVAMAKGALEHSSADLAVSVTGFAGSGGPGDEAGLVHLAVCGERRGTITRECHFGDVGRDRVRFLAASAALEMLEELVSNR